MIPARKPLTIMAPPAIPPAVQVALAEMRSAVAELRAEVALLRADLRRRPAPEALVEEGPELPARAVLEAVCQLSGLTIADMRSARRGRPAAWPRQVAMLLAVELCPHLTYPQIGWQFGGRDQTTVRYSADGARRRLAAGHEPTVRLYEAAKQELQR